MKKPAFFLDRDGVINVDHGYVHTPEEFEFIDGIFEVVAAAKQAGYLVVVETNQAGVLACRSKTQGSQTHLMATAHVDQSNDARPHERAAVDH